MTTQTSSIPCPQCENGQLSAVATAPYARGFLLAYQMGSKKIVGCKRCVAGGLRQEAGKSLLFGWFSITALILNIFFIPWNLLRSFFVSDDDLAVSKFLDEVGVPKPGTEYRLTDAFYSAAATMIRADGKIEDAEIEAAVAIGQQMLPEFDAQAFLAVLDSKAPTQSLDATATVFRVYLTEEGQTMVFRYLMGIALADGDFAKSEDKMMERLADKIGIGKQAYRTFRDEMFEAT